MVTAIIPAAGIGLRLKKKAPKALVQINRRPIFIHTLDVISRHEKIKEIIICAPDGYLEIFKNYIKKYRIKKIQGIIPGGVTRRESVENGLRILKPKTRLVLIHDAVRPFIDKKIVSQTINQAKKYGAAIVGIPVKATIKKVQSKKNHIVDQTLDRDNIWEIQTPQVFKKELILKAYDKFKDKKFTDDSSLVERSGFRVRLVKGSCLNIKITTPDDLIIAGAILKNRV